MSEPESLVEPAPIEWLIRKGGYFYRRNWCGYTTVKAEAGRYTEAEARREAEIEPWHMSAIHQNDVPDPPEDANVAEIAKLKAELSTLRSRCETLEERLATAYRVKAECNDVANEERRKRLVAEAARDAAVAALEPFAKLADQIDAWGHGDDSTCEHRLKASDIRRARAVLPAPPSGDAL